MPPGIWVAEFGRRRVPLQCMIDWTADWLMRGGGASHEADPRPGARCPLRSRAGTSNPAPSRATPEPVRPSSIPGGLEPEQGRLAADDRFRARFRHTGCGGDIIGQRPGVAARAGDLLDQYGARDPAGAPQGSRHAPAVALDRRDRDKWCWVMGSMPRTWAGRSRSAVPASATTIRCRAGARPAYEEPVDPPAGIAIRAAGPADLARITTGYDCERSGLERICVLGNLLHGCRMPRTSPSVATAASRGYGLGRDRLSGDPRRPRGSRYQVIGMALATPPPAAARGPAASWTCPAPSMACSGSGFSSHGGSAARGFMRMLCHRPGGRGRQPHLRSRWAPARRDAVEEDLTDAVDTGASCRPTCWPSSVTEW